MLVHRNIWLAKRGCRSHVRQIGNAEVKSMNAPHAVRCLQPAYGGSGDTVIWEFEFQDISELDEYWAEWLETRGDAFFEKMNPLAERLSHEILALVD